MNLQTGLIGHWPLDRGPRDCSGAGLTTVARAVGFGAVEPGAPASAAFDGATSRLEVAPDPRLDTGTGDFAAALWVCAGDDGVDVAGDLLSRYDPESRRGWHLGLVSLPGVTTSMANDRNLHFGVDQAVSEPGWTACGRPGRAVFVYALTVFAGHLYAATCEPGAGEAGHVYRYEGGGWVDCGAPAACNSVTCLASLDGHLYCGVSRYRLSGSCLPDSPNQTPGGGLYRYGGGTQWVQVGQLEDEGVHCLSAFAGRLYAAPMRSHQVYEFDAGGRGRPIGPPARVMSLGFWNGHLYALTSGADSVYRYDGDGAWTDCGCPPGTHQQYSFLVHQDQPLVGTWPLGEVFRFAGPGQWASCGSPGYSREVMGMALYNGQVYAGTLPMGDVYRYGGGRAWAFTGSLERSHGFQLRRAWSMAVWGGRLYCGTLPSGLVYSYQAGRLVTWDRRFPDGWHHVAAVRRGRGLELFVDGRTAARSADFDPAVFDLSNGRPLLIGAGQHDVFRGRLRDVRLYGRALEASEVAALAAA
ncbi:MAG: LamG domain-containing protein [Gemmatimonadota bacterium]